jgi:hypothetical protein
VKDALRTATPPGPKDAQIRINIQEKIWLFPMCSTCEQRLRVPAMPAFYYLAAVFVKSPVPAPDKYLHHSIFSYE